MQKPGVPPRLVATASDVYPMICQRPLTPDPQPLLELLVMVKNAGPEFRTMLEKNLPWVDAWAILDTGSTDETLDIVREMHEQHFPDKPFVLFQEPFINFRDSRNRLLELRRDSDCFFQIMLDDTYIIENAVGLRAFLDLVRYEVEPIKADSFSLFIRSPDMAYLSNRIIKTKGVPPHRPPLRYDPRFRIHEIIQPNKTFSLPEYFGYLHDVSSEYMQNRTKARKERDLEMLFADLAALPGSLRVMYYLAETFLCQGDYEKAAYWYGQRANSKNPYAPEDDYDEERYDAKYKLAVMHYLHLNSPWNGTCLELFLAAYAYMPKRPEALFMIGFHYHTEKSYDLAYVFLKAAFEVGPPAAHGMNLILEQYYYHGPRLLAPLCLSNRAYVLGEKVVQRHTQYYEVTSSRRLPFMDRLGNIFRILNSVHPPLSDTTTAVLKEWRPQKRFVVFVTGCGWAPYHGRTLRDKGLGGSETCIIQLAENIAAMAADTYQPIIFCPCDRPGTIFRQVFYEDISAYPAFLRWLSEKAETDTANQKHRIFLQRSTEYMWVTSELKIPFYLHLHDIVPDQELLTGHHTSLYQGTICLSEYHRGLFVQQFADQAAKTHVLGYGLPDYATAASSSSSSIAKRKHLFFFPSFPNRGLLVLLRDLWARILGMWPDAKLVICCDFQNAWLQKVAGAELQQIQELMQTQFADSVRNVGWQPPHIVRSFWEAAEYWLYPCTFAETFCLTALEAQYYQCKCITCDLGALPETGRYSAHIIPGDPRSLAWQNAAIMKLQELDQVDLLPRISSTSYPTFQNSVTRDFLRRFCDASNIEFHPNA